MHGGEGGSAWRRRSRCMEEREEVHGGRGLGAWMEEREGRKATKSLKPGYFLRDELNTSKNMTGPRYF